MNTSNIGAYVRVLIGAIRISWVIIAILVYLVDDYETDWHELHTFSVARIFAENIGEDILAVGAYLLFKYIIVDPDIRGPIRGEHVECPRCGMKWWQDPKASLRACSRCSMEEPN